MARAALLILLSGASLGVLELSEPAAGLAEGEHALTLRRHLWCFLIDGTSGVPIDVGAAAG